MSTWKFLPASAAAEPVPPGLTTQSGDAEKEVAVAMSDGEEREVQMMTRRPRPLWLGQLQAMLLEKRMPS
jgi:hypothetical protein